MRRIWLVGTAIAALVAVPAINMQAQAAAFDTNQAATSGTTMILDSDDAIDVACSCGGGEGGGESGGGDSGGGDSGGGGGSSSGGGGSSSGGGGSTGGGGTEGGREGSSGDAGELPN